MDLAGLETPESVQGRSLAPVLQGETESIRDLVHSERRGGITMQFDGRWKFIDNGEGAQHELYDLQEDPREITNLAMNDEYSDRVRGPGVRTQRLERSGCSSTTVRPEVAAAEDAAGAAVADSSRIECRGGRPWPPAGKDRISPPLRFRSRREFPDRCGRPQSLLRL